MSHRPGEVDLGAWDANVQGMVKIECSDRRWDLRTSQGHLGSVHQLWGVCIICGQGMAKAESGIILLAGGHLAATCHFINAKGIQSGFVHWMESNKHG